jgi:hypothetical protein
MAISGRHADLVLNQASSFLIGQGGLSPGRYPGCRHQGSSAPAVTGSGAAGGPGRRRLQVGPQFLVKLPLSRFQHRGEFGQLFPEQPLYVFLFSCACVLITVITRSLAGYFSRLSWPSPSDPVSSTEVISTI